MPRGDSRWEARERARLNHVVVHPAPFSQSRDYGYMEEAKRRARAGRAQVVGPPLQPLVRERRAAAFTPACALAYPLACALAYGIKIHGPEVQGRVSAGLSRVATSSSRH